MFSPSRRALTAIALTAALGLTLTACGDDDSDNTEAKSETSTADSSVSAAASETDSEDSEPSAEASGYGGDEMTDGEKKNEEFKNTVSDDELLKGLKEGGWVVFLRHGQTEKDYADQADEKMDVNDCSTQRALSEKGLKQAATIGEAFKAAEIPVDKVTSSEYCRAWETAQLAFGKYEKSADLNFAKAEEYTNEQVEQMKNGIEPLLVRKPAAGMNDVIVGHDDVFEAATGIYPAPQGISYVVKPLGDSFELVAKLSPKDWEKLTSK